MFDNEIKKKLFNEIITFPNYLGRYNDYDGILTFLSKIWNLKEMPSYDNRFKTAYEDIHQHIINNDDWSIDYLYLDRLSLLKGDEIYFIQFIELVVNPIVRFTREEIFELTKKINDVLLESEYKLALVDFFEELPVYRLLQTEDSLNELPIDIPENNIPIYLSSVSSPIEFPYFVLQPNNWDDYSHVTMFSLIYRPEQYQYETVGKVKIMKRGTKHTVDVLKNKFYNLSNQYCSLGQEKQYYLRLKEILGIKYSSFLLALRDVATFPKINDQFENNNIYKKSLLRFDEAERLVRTIRFEIEGINDSEYFKFNFTTKPPYANNNINLNFDFEYNTDFEHRIYALIGKNGTGKTRILSNLAKNLSDKESTNFSPRKPVYGKVFTVSYSYFDKFDIPNSDLRFNYVYCGLKKSNNTWKTEEEMLQSFYKAADIIKSKSLERDWKRILTHFIPPEILAYLEFYDLETSEEEKFNIEKFKEVNYKLSSGQSTILFIVTEILSQIRYDSLILYDEPETHLHPNAISSLMNTLFELVRRFQSFCIIATHSPLILQELPSRNVFVIERDEDTSYVRRLERETFGENLTVITQDIFGNSEVPKHFVNIIRHLVEMNKSYEEIIRIIEMDLPITSTVRLTIKALMKN